MKQRLSKLALLAVAAAFIVAGFPACDDGEDESSPVVLASIQVQTNPTKTTYSVGDTTLDPTGLVVKEVYNNGVTIDVEYNDENKDAFAFDFDSSKPSNSVTVTVTYKEKTAEFTVSVAANEPDPDKTIASIAVKTKPAKTEYTAGDTTLEPDGLVITVTYDDADSTTEPIAYSEANKDDFSFDYDFSKADDSVTVTVTYKEKTAEFTVSVVANEPKPDKTIASIAVKTNPTKTEYTADETLDPAGLVITVTYDDADSTTDSIGYGEANKDDFSFDYDFSKAGDSVTVTVTYKEKTATFTVSVAEAEKSLFETLSAQDNNVLKEDFAAFTVSKFGAGFGKVGVYGDDGVTVADGAISTGAAGTNRKIYVDFGLVKETVEGCVTLTVGGTQPQSGKSLLTFYNGDSVLLTLKTGEGDNTVGGTAGTYEIYYKFDLTAKTVSLTVNGKAVLTDSALTADSVSGYTIESHNSGKGTVTADDIAVCATEGDLATYKAQVKALLATLVENSYSEAKGYTVNKEAVTQAKNAGDSEIDAADSIETVLAAYGNAKAALGQVKNDLAQAKANACTELEGYFPEGKDAENYTKDQLAAVEEAKEAGKTAINAATTTDAVNEALADAKKAIDALPDNSATAYTVTVIADGEEIGTVDTYTTVADVLDKIKELVKDSTKVIAGGKLYSNKECTTEYDTATELTGDVTVYVTLEEKKTTTYVLTPDMLGTDWTNPANGTMTSITTDGVMFKAGNNVTYDNSSKNLPTGISAAIKTGGSLQKNGKNSIVFTTNGPSTVTMEFFSTSTSERTAGYVEGTDTSPVSNNAWTGSAIGGSVTVKEAKVIYTETFNIEKAGTYSLGGSNGISITKITVTVEE